MFSERYIKTKVFKKPHFPDPSLPFKKRVKCVVSGHKALKGPGEDPVGVNLTFLCLPAGIVWHMLWLSVSRTDLREGGMEQDYLPNSKALS